MKRYSHYLGAIGTSCLVVAVLWVLPEEVSLFLNIPGLFLVIGGTIIATCVSRRRRHVVSVLRSLPALVFNKKNPSNLNAKVDRFLGTAESYRRSRIRMTEEMAARIGDGFAQSGIALVVDRVEPAEMNKIFQWRINAIASAEQAKIQVVKTMANFAPALGMLGTLVAMVHMLYGLESADINEIGRSMAFAMITTLYGIIISNLICKPLAIKMEQALQQKMLVLNMWVEGINGMAAKRHPQLIREAMDTFLMQNEQYEAEVPALVLATN